MGLQSNVVINIYSIVILFVIYHQCLKQDEKIFLQYKLYIKVLQITILMLVVDIFSRFDGNSGTIYSVLNHVGNCFIFILNPVLSSFWLLYAHDQVFQNEEKTRKLYFPLIIINVVNAVIVVLTQFFGWYYYIDSNNIYHRGPLFSIAFSITLILMIIAFLLIITNRKKIDNNHYFSLVFFAIPPFVCSILQIIFYGISIVLNSVVLSLLIVFLNIQNHSIYTDYLTGVSNRKKLDIYLREKIKSSTENKTFSAIMIDLNNFKTINDTYGHDSGDYALRISAKLLNSCIKPKDFIARFGGDEFCLVLDVYDKVLLENIVRRINNCIEMYNETSDKPYIISFSMGYEVYDYNSNMGIEEFQKHIDKLMYENKMTNKGKEIFGIKRLISFE